MINQPLIKMQSATHEVNHALNVLMNLLDHYMSVQVMDNIGVDWTVRHIYYTTVFFQIRGVYPLPVLEPPCRLFAWIMAYRRTGEYCLWGQDVTGKIIHDAETSVDEFRELGLVID